MSSDVLDSATKPNLKRYQIVDMAGRGLCMISLIFASGDVWPTLRVGFTFRLAQLASIVAVVFLMSRRRKTVRTVVGFRWLYAFLAVIAIELPLSLYPVRSVAYTVWAINDVLIILTFVQYFDSLSGIEKLLKWFTASFILIALFGWVQFFVGLAGHSLFTTEWWIPGRLPRVNGLSYEPSYYATYLIAGWVYAAYLIEVRADCPSPRLQRMCLVTTTISLIICTSRLGWAMMLLWVVFRSVRRIVIDALSGSAPRMLFRRTPVVLLAAAAVGGVMLTHVGEVATSLNEMSFLAQGLGLFGESSHSAQPRIDRLEDTWRAFESHPISGAGIGALPVEIARQSDEGIYNLADAKAHQGMSIFVELLGSTGVLGATMVVGFALAVLREMSWLKKFSSDRRRFSVSALGWGIVWMLGILQFNQNFLRVYLFTDLGVLAACLAVLKRNRYSAEEFDQPDRLVPTVQRVRG